MKYQANGGYQIINFEGVAIEDVTTLDYGFIANALLRQKVLLVVGVTIGDKVVNGVANGTFDATNNVVEVVIGEKKLTIASDDSVTLSDAIIPTSRKLYYHPIYSLTKDSSNNPLYLCYAILNNTNVVYDSNAPLFALLDLGAIINCTGFIMINGTYWNVMMCYKAGNDYYIRCSDGSDVQDLAVLTSYTTTQQEFKDGVNEIYPNL